MSKPFNYMRVNFKTNKCKMELKNIPNKKANSEYFYQDGVFYSKGASGEYQTILPPAGGLVETLPEDFEMVTLKDGNEYYKVDDTVYALVIIDGKAYFEVIGQLYK
jgi:hypothetical protein